MKQLYVCLTTKAAPQFIFIFLHLPRKLSKTIAFKIRLEKGYSWTTEPTFRDIFFFLIILGVYDKYNRINKMPLESLPRSVRSHLMPCNFNKRLQKETEEVETYFKPVQQNTDSWQFYWLDQKLLPDSQIRCVLILLPTYKMYYLTRVQYDESCNNSIK